MKNRFKVALGLLLINSSAFATAAPIPNVSLFQLSTASALFSGVIESDTKYAELKSKGNFGLGTFNNIDGEMIAINGTFYKIKPDGKTLPVNPNEKTPFVELVNFSPSISQHFENIPDLANLQKLLRLEFDNTNIAYAIKVNGLFKYLQLRSRTPRSATQHYNLVENIYTIRNVKGTLVGFWTPPYLLNLTVPEFHFHFISDDKKLSGHVLELQAQYTDIMLNKITKIELALPQHAASKNIVAATLDNYNNSQMHKPTKANFTNNIRLIEPAAELQWHNMPHSAGKYAVIAGDPKQTDFFVIRVKFPPNYAIVAHHHNHAEYDTVITGSCYIAKGQINKKENGLLATAGTFVAIPPNVEHYGWTGNEGAIIQLSGMGPWKPIYE